MRILVAGGSGFLGRNLIPYLLKKYPDYHLVNLDRRPLVLRKRQYLCVEGDARNEELAEKLYLEHQFDAVINLANDTTSVPVRQLESNIGGQFVLLTAAQKHKTEKFIYISSDDVYTTPSEVTWPHAALESDLVSPFSMRGAFRIAAESLALAFSHSRQVPVVILRPADGLGPWLNPERLIGLFLTQALQNNPLPIYHEGKRRQEVLFVEDFCSAVDNTLHTEGIEGEIFNLGWSVQHSILDIAKLLLTYLEKPDTMLRFIEESEKALASKPPLDVTKAQQKLGWEPKVKLSEGLQKTIDWFKKNPAWWSSENKPAG